MAKFRYPSISNLIQQLCISDTCSPNPCKNNGTCETHTEGRVKCQCKENDAGERCEYQGKYLDFLRFSKHHKIRYLYT